MNTTPNDFVSDDSGFRFALPENVPAHWLEVQVKPPTVFAAVYCANVMPVNAHWAAEY